MKIRISYKRNLEIFQVFIILMVLQPVIDTINGIYVLNNNNPLFSIGTIYRFVIFVFVIYVLFQKSLYSDLLMLVPLGLYLLFISFSHGVCQNMLGKYLLYATKWMTPIIIIVCVNSLMMLDKDKTINAVKFIWETYVWLYPICFIAPFFLGVGFNTYSDGSGYRGLFASTNDIAYIFCMLFIYVAYKLLEKINIINLWKTIIIGGCCIVLGTKMGYIVVLMTSFFICIYFFIKFLRKNRNLSKVFLTFLSIGTVAIFGLRRFSTIIRGIIYRWIKMLSTSTGILSFLTSGRVDRIGEAISEGMNNNLIQHILFGWRAPLDGLVIEMDFLDAFFQFGIIGFMIILCIYLVLTANLKAYSLRIQYMYFISLIYAILGGHVISAAVAGTIFGLMYSLRFVYDK